MKKITKTLCLLGMGCLPLLPVSPVMADEAATPHCQIINRAAFDHYIALFNGKNPKAFEACYADDIRMQNGHLVLNGIPAVKEHYRKIWSVMKEELNVVNYTSDGDNLAIELKAHFTAEKDAEDSPFGKVKQGENFDYHGVIMYKINADGKFYDIKVAYLDFTRTTDGVTKSLGMAH
ncbi:nuclear transport factor 2 family protein [Parathalassolituus penaei]|uniref:Nuclear transport factor 2 family protein n=1 Tax=Parathalassolituus penaei TaxID=2997323 RepID=A0A9X3ITV1_9GAMM|nr:nuclear transport factor 2 family protein [Parathalassolituus penaei]MCY0966279.1 nuclear transport factor 2 family protein [Parathalassolituus penaei]